MDSFYKRHSVLLNLARRYKSTLVLLAVSFVFFLPSMVEINVKENFMIPFSLSILTITGYNLLKSRRYSNTKWHALCLLCLLFIWLHVYLYEDITIAILKFSTMLVLLIFMVWKIFMEMQRSKSFNLQLMVVTFTGYVLMGLIGLMAFLIIEEVNPGSFSILPGKQTMFDDLTYLSYSSLTTIGVGDIKPITQAARKITVLLGICGQFYLATMVVMIVSKLLKTDIDDTDP